MTDAKIYDISISGSSIDSEEGLKTAITLSLFTWARASPDAILADPLDRKGWWADTYADTPGDAFGSQLWQLIGNPLDTSTLDTADRMIREALQWMVDDGLIGGVEVELEIVRHGVLGATISVLQPQQPATWFADLWEISLGS
jgi:phage gp46-like protein